MKKTFAIITIGFVSMLGVLSFLLKGTTYPSPDTRVILEKHYKTYIAPPCFEQSDPEPTNFLGESTLKEAQDDNYTPHDVCTEEKLEEEKEVLIISLLKNIGILPSKWDKW